MNNQNHDSVSDEDRSHNPKNDEEFLGLINMLKNLEILHQYQN